MTRSVTKAAPIQFINAWQCHIKKRNSHKTSLSSYYKFLSRDLLLMALGVDTHIFKHTDTQAKAISRN